MSEQEPNKVKLMVKIRDAWLPRLTVEQLQRIVAIIEEVTE
jgi:hypothetical protein